MLHVFSGVVSERTLGNVSCGAEAMEPDYKATENPVNIFCVL
jgi:hypothetical protein